MYTKWERDLTKDLARLRDVYGTKFLVTLLEQFELKRASIPTLRQRLKRAGMMSLWFPIADVADATIAREADPARSRGHRSPRRG
jgi:hypothetical protein